MAREHRVHTTQFPFISHSIVCTSLTEFGHVIGSSQVPKYFLRESIPSRTPDMFVGQGIPSVRGYRQPRILLRHLSPQGVGLQNWVHVWLSPDRSIGGRRGRHCVSSKSAVVGDDKQGERSPGRFQRVPLVGVLISSLGSGVGGFCLLTTPYLPSSRA